MAKSFKDILNDLKAQGSALFTDIENQSKQVANDFLASLKGQAPTPEEADDIAWATTAMTAAKVLGVGASEEQTAALDQEYADGKAILANAAAQHAHEAQELVEQTENKVLGVIQQIVLRGEQVLISGLLTALVAA